MARFILLTLFLFSTSIAFSCDFCNSLMGINPYYSGKNKLMINYLFQQSTQESYDPHAMPHHLFSHSPAVSKLNGLSDIKHMVDGFKETRTTVEIAYQHHITENWLISAFIPFIVSANHGTEHHHPGFGDLSTMIHYIIKPEAIGSEQWVFLIGGGVKFPIAKNTMTNSAGIRYDMMVQPGTGTWDYYAQFTGIYQWNLWTFAGDFTGKFNGKNKYDEQFGNTYSTTANISRELYRQNESSFALIGGAGIRSEFNGETQLAANSHLEGYHTGFFNTSLHLVYDSFRLNITALFPLWGTQPINVPKEHTRWSSGIRYEF